MNETENPMIINEYWPEYNTLTEEEYDRYLEYLDNEYEQANEY